MKNTTYLRPILVTDYVQKRRGQAVLFSFEYNLLPNLISKSKWIHRYGISYVIFSAYQTIVYFSVWYELRDPTTDSQN